MNPVENAVAWDFEAMGLNVPSFPSWHVTPEERLLAFIMYSYNIRDSKYQQGTDCHSVHWNRNQISYPYYAVGSVLGNLEAGQHNKNRQKAGDSKYL